MRLGVPQIVLVPAHIHGDESANDDRPIAGRMSFDFDCIGWDGAASETITASTIIVDVGSGAATDPTGGDRSPTGCRNAFTSAHYRDRTHC
jgi:hypothetical protein